jgi:outer membrane murein-binding lipoprotein Lpp
MTFTLQAPIRRITLPAVVIGLFLAGFAGSAAAQSTDGQSETSAIQQLQAMQQEMRQRMDELRSIQEAATRANPELAAEQEAYRDLVIDTMSDQDFDAEAEFEDMRSLQAELESGESLGEQEREETMRALQKKQERFQARQQEAMQTEEVQVMRADLDQKIKAAMAEQNPDTPQLIDELTELQQEYRVVLEKAMRESAIDAPQG